MILLPQNKYIIAASDRNGPNGIFREKIFCSEKIKEKIPAKVPIADDINIINIIPFIP